MAITKTVTLQRCETYPGTPADPSADPPVAEIFPRLMVCLTEVFDSASDDLLPVTATGVYHFEKGDGVTSMPALVQTIATAIWA